MKEASGAVSQQMLQSKTITPVYYTVEYYSAIQKSEILPSAAKQTDLEIIILSEVSQAEKDKHYMTSLICGI